MQITVTRSGGFAGLTETLFSLSTDELSSSARERIVALLQDAGFFALPEVLPRKAVGADRFRYQISVVDGPSRHSVTFVADDSASGTALEALIAELEALGNTPSTSS